MNIHHQWAGGRYLVNTGDKLLGVDQMLEDDDYKGRLEKIPEKLATAYYKVIVLTDPHYTISEDATVLSSVYCCLLPNNQLHQPRRLCMLIVTVLSGRLLYQVYNATREGIDPSSWYLVYEEVVPVDMQIAPAANISLGLSALKLRGLLNR